MVLTERKAAFSRLGALLEEKIKSMDREFSDLVNSAWIKNRWFTPEWILTSLSEIAKMLLPEKLDEWLLPYGQLEEKDKKVGVVMAGNIPAVGFHDLLCVLVSGNKLMCKCSSDDTELIHALAQWLIEIEPRFKERIEFVNMIKAPDAVIATGGNNAARYFEYYFGKYPHIIRKNRNSVAVVDGKETEEELKLLGYDIFSYFGLGCRNVSKIYMPVGYDIAGFFRSMEPYANVMQHNKYMNNYAYYHSIYLLNNENFLTNNFLILKEEKQIATPVSVIHYEYYNSAENLTELLEKEKNEIQCIVGRGFVPFGKSQSPALDDYADGIDTMKFLCGI